MSHAHINETHSKVRTLVEETKQILSPIAARSYKAEKCSYYAMNCMICLLFPVFIIWLGISFIFLTIDSTFKCNTLKYILWRPLEYLGAIFVFILHPITSLHMLLKSTKLRKHASEITSIKATKVYVIPREKIFMWNSFPKHEDVINELQVKNINELKYDSPTEAVTIFVSHKWFDNNKPDSIDHAIFKQVQLALLNNTYKTHVWFDYTCVPQAEESSVERNAMLLAIADLLSKCDIRPFFINKDHIILYKNSVWCQLEAMAIYQGITPKVKQHS
jgi:hypothetical protein